MDDTPITSLIIHDVLIHYLHILVSVWPVLFMPEPEAVKDLVCYFLLVHTARGCEVHYLLPSLLTNIGPAAFSKDLVLDISENGEP